MSVANLDFSIGNLCLEGKSLIFEATAITKDFVPQHLLKHFAETAVNKEIRFSHISPDKKIESFLGRVLMAEAQGGLVKIKGEIQGYTAEQLAVQQWIREQQAKNDPVGISMGLVLYKNKGTDELVNVEAREASVTDHPACEVCRITKLLNEKMNGEKREMSTPTTPTAQVPTTNPGVPPVTQVDPKIAELEKKLALMTKENAALQEFIAGLSAAHDNALKELEKAKTLPVRNEIASLQKLEGAEYLAEITRLEAMPSTMLGEIRERILRSRGGPSAPRSQAIPASTFLQPQKLDLDSITDPSEKIRVAEELYKKNSKRSVS